MNMYWRCSYVFVYVFLHMLFACINVSTLICIFCQKYLHNVCTYSVSICMYPCSYLHISQAVSANIPICIFMYPGSYLHSSQSVPVLICMFPFVPERIQVQICLCPVCVCICKTRISYTVMMYIQYGIHRICSKDQ